ncbi:cyclase family protein [Sphingosinicella sp. LHD-64]|uniref:cyclase family protein n=1 Tax=Sphingosinicella sp. LHD-64 TaxID=3072139 RepID=UPI00280E9599|nr:cyclase family protein [Sphingosinicella sp. LHD-64]MDQ8757080.1 cyclase family protein [Sphingosinicella sp. LHD-64]
MEHQEGQTLVDLSHVIEDGMTTHKGLPGPHICDFWQREASAAFYDDGSTFQIGRIDMVANTGTYLDSPFHRFAGGADLAGLKLGQLVALPGLVLRTEATAIDRDLFEGHDLAGKAVLVHTGWDRHWRTDAYQTGHPHLTEAAAHFLARQSVALVGIDSHNIDDTGGRARPVHTVLLGNDILICEHMTNLGALPDAGFLFTAVPPKIAGMGTFPVRAFAMLGETIQAR